MKYISTRGGASPLGFEAVVMDGLARDGGLFLPEQIPDIRNRLSVWRSLSYPALAFEIMRLFADVPDAELKALIHGSYSDFRHPDVTPLVTVGDLHVLELFHGPTLAFKDVALQFLGRLFEHYLQRSGRELNILAATSGDTGSAAIYGVRGRRGIRIFVMYPQGRISPAQERQMATVPDANVFALAVEGHFDDCQDIVKTLFNDLEFRDRCSLGAVNSINFSRILAQIVYYFYAAFRVMGATGCERVRSSVPTGNFGDIFAGWLAWRMGLPISRLILATNENDILSRFFNTGVYVRGRLASTLSPSMDIQVASNFERYLYYRAGESPETLRQWMDTFAQTGRLTIGGIMGTAGDPLFGAGVGDTESTLATIRSVYERTGYVLDPHAAVGVTVGRAFQDPKEPLICLATAHPAKFSEAIIRAIGKDVAHHEILDALKPLPLRRTLLPAQAGAVKTFMEQHLELC